jgi:hypothetical protein
MDSNLCHDGGLFGIKHQRLGFRRKPFPTRYLAHDGGLFSTIVGTASLVNRCNPINRKPDLFRVRPADHQMREPGFFNEPDMIAVGNAHRSSVEQSPTFPGRLRSRLRVRSQRALGPTGSVNVVNESSDPLGAGWSIGGLQKLSQLTTDGPVLITNGQQGTGAFQSTCTEGQSYVQDLALATSASAVQVITNNSAGDFSASVSVTDTVVGTVAGDFNDDGEPDLAVLTSSTLAIKLNDGSGGVPGRLYSTQGAELGMVSPESTCQHGRITLLNKCKSQPWDDTMSARR